MNKFNIEYRQRLRIIQIIVPAGLAVLLLFAKALLPQMFFDILGQKSDLFYNVTIISLMVMSGGSLLLLYLQTGFKFRPESSESRSYHDSELRMIHQQLDKQAAVFQDNIESLSVQLKDIRAASEERPIAEGLLSEEERRNLVESMTRNVRSETADKVLSDLRKQIAVADSSTAIRNIAERFGLTINRLLDEIAALTRRGNLNLVLGILTTVIGLAILGYFVFNYPLTGIPSVIIIGFLPRLSLVIFIEVFAYFFLRLYKASLTEIKYFQNELTNVEAKAIALETSAVLGGDTIEAVIEKIASTERNNVLDKGQTTVELEQAKIQDEKLSNVIKDAISVIKQQRQGGT